jgi:hypothetical protein
MTRQQLGPIRFGRMECSRDLEGFNANRVDRTIRIRSMHEFEGVGAVCQSISSEMATRPTVKNWHESNRS